ncbi:MAG: hypothetical protein QOJ51_1482 [Acidobacteriaceae bacterium]|nr:hypothetical protein [Acidobacteriaceae bacterium]
MTARSSEGTIRATVPSLQSTMATCPSSRFFVHMVWVKGGSKQHPPGGPALQFISGASAWSRERIVGHKTRGHRELRRIRSRRAHSVATAYSRRNRQLQQIVASARKASSRPAGRRVAVPASADGLRPPEWRERILAWMGSSLTFIRQLTQGQSYTRR